MEENNEQQEEVIEEGWHKAGRNPHVGRFLESPGPKGEAGTLLESGGKPIEFFKLFFDNELLDLLTV